MPGHVVLEPAAERDGADSTPRHRRFPGVRVGDQHRFGEEALQFLELVRHRFLSAEVGAPAGHGRPDEF
jgi:hypothetical protein